MIKYDWKVDLNFQRLKSKEWINCQKIITLATGNDCLRLSVLYPPLAEHKRTSFVLK